MSAHEFLEATLLERYRSLGNENEPVWAVHKRNSDEIVKATIPFIGKNYGEQSKKILVYASAENLSGYWKGNTKTWVGDWLDDDLSAENRHRRCFQESIIKQDSFFPNVHIGPMNDGYLATAVYYIAAKLYQVDFDNPKNFYETIAFGNYGKYSIETARQRNARKGVDDVGSNANMDYAGNRELLAVSHDYIRADLEVLNPDCIIMPKTMYWADKAFIDQNKGNAHIVPISQMNTRVVNCHIVRMYKGYERAALPHSVQKWYDELPKGIKAKEKYLSVFTYLDGELEKAVQQEV